MPVTERQPASLGPYRLEDRLGEGGMGVVYLARAPGGQPVAIKVLRVLETDVTARTRLAREVETMLRVRSPYVAEVLDADLTGEQPYIVTRYVPGITLDEMVRRNGPLSTNGLDRLAKGLAEALAAIHAAGVVHRDLKPGNVMMTDDRPVVIDFGIAQAPEATRLTQTGMVMGTPGYLAPEVIEGHPSSAASDIFAWGATVAFAATGRSPFGEGSFETVFYRVVSGRYDLNGVPSSLGPLITAALDREPSRRPPAAWLASPQAQEAAPKLAQAQAMGNGTGYAPTIARTPMSQTRMMTPGPVPTSARLLPSGPIGRSGIPTESRGPAETRGRAAAGNTPRWLPGLAFAIALAALAIVLPVAGLIFALAAVTLLRAFDGPIQRVYLAPVKLIRSVLTTTFVAPLAFGAGALVWILTIALTHHPATPKAPAYAAAAFVTVYTLGPGSGRPRRAVHRMLSPFARTPVSALAGTVATWALTAAAVSLAASQSPDFWPAVLPHGLPHIAQFPKLPGMPRWPGIHFPKLHPPSLHSLFSSAQRWLSHPHF